MTAEAQRLGDAVLLQGAAVAEAVHLLSLGLRWRARVDGAGPTRRHRELLAVLADAAGSALPVSAPGHPAVRRVPDSSRWAETAGTTIGTEEAARMLSVSTRQTRRLAGDLDGRRREGRWCFDRSAVVAEAARRRARNKP